MNALRIAITFVVLSLTALAQVPPDQQAQQEMTLGVKAYRIAHYEDAVEHFQRAALLDPGLCKAKVYLATTYAQLYVPGVDVEDNVANANKAIDSYKATLQCDPHSVNSQKGIAFLNLQLHKFDEAKQAYREALKLDDKDPELYYFLGVIDWTEAFANSTKGRIPMEAPKFDPKCPDLRSQNAAVVDDGIQMTTRAIELRKDYDDAMAYISMLYGERAKIECDDQTAKAADLKKADEWRALAMQARKRKAAAEDEAARKCAGKAPVTGCMASQAK